MDVKFLLPAIFLVITGCAGTVVEVEPGQNSQEREISQLSVVNTHFEGSVLYEAFNRLRSSGPLIPGLNHFLVPQGMAYREDLDQMIISAYMSDHSAGTLTILDMKNGSLEKVLFLHDSDGSPHRGHLGGLAVSRKFLWIASGAGIYYIPLEKLESYEDQSRVYLTEIIKTETKASFATFSENILWIGEFALKNGNYPVSKSHLRIDDEGLSYRAWMGGYVLDPKTDMVNLPDNEAGKVFPDLILSIPDKIQGALFFQDRIMLSESYGRKNKSRLLIYENPLYEPGAQPEEKDWFLSDRNQRGEMILPPMSEAILWNNKGIAILFESAADKYRATASFPLDRIQYLPLDVFDMDHLK